MKILHVIDQLNIGGGERVFITICNLLKQHEHDITALFLLEAGNLQKDLKRDIPFIELKRINKWNINKMWQCSRKIKEYHIIHCHFKHVFKYIQVVNKLFFLNKKIILNDHGHNSSKLNSILFRYFLKPNFYIGVNKPQCEWAVRTLRMRSSNTFLLENIVLLAEKKINLLEATELVMVSNIKPEKNIKFVLSLTRNLKRSLTLIGNKQSSHYYNEIEEAIKELKIKVLHGISDTQPLLSNFSLGLHTSASETGPLVLIEYLAQGLPFLAYETGEVAKILKPYFPEYFIDNFDQDQWKSRIEFLLIQTPNYDLMNKVFKEHFGEEQYYKKLKSIYQCIVAS